MFIYETFIKISILQFLLFAVFLLTSRHRKLLSNRLLAIFLVSKVLCYLQDFFWIHHEYTLAHLPFLFYIGPAFDLVLGPALYFHIQSLTKDNMCLTMKHMAHMVPFFIYLAVMGVLFHQFDTVTKTALLKNGFPGVTGLFVHDLVLYLHFLVYTTASLIKIHGYQTRLKNHYSSIKQKRINWIIFLISGFMVIWISGSVNLVTGYLFHALVIPWPMIIFTIFIFANGIILTGLYSQDIFLAVPDKPVEKIKYEKNRIDQGSLQQILSAIGTLMKEKKPYLNPDFNLQVLSDRAGIKPHAISQAINTCLRKNFYDYINEFRIMESKRLLIHNVNGRGENGSAKKTVLEILYEAGFNSKSTFHRAFKKQTGTTPTYFLKSITKNTTSPSIS